MVILKNILRSVPLLSDFLFWAYNFVKLPRNLESIKLEINKINSEHKLAVPVSNGVILVKVEDFIVGFPAEDYGLVASYTFADNIELGFRKLFRKCLKEGMVVVDVGANVGIYTLIAASNVGNNGRVYSFEPTPRIFGILENNVNMTIYKTRVILFQKAVTDLNGAMVKLAVSMSCSRNNSLYFDEEDGDRFEFVDVESVTLDSTLVSEKSIDIVKIDAEGAEPKILAGMRRIIKQNPQILVFLEFAPTHFKKSGVALLDFVNQISEYGFKTYRIDDFSDQLSILSTEALLSGFAGNILLKMD
ncbi:MAG: FkbM family methyltransferase [Desulfobacteraceae bacterium]|nr:FkbM family methyltransferase [Desulfobacteraceae bacterium]